MKIVILTRDVPNQVALCHLLEPHCEIKAIVVSENIPKKKPDFSKNSKIFLNRISQRLVGKIFVTSWFEALKEYQKDYANFPDVPLVKVKNVNEVETLETLEKYSPDLVIVSSTNLVGKKVIETAKKKKGIVNLHTGISPYVKGGPNCTNWCLAQAWFHLIGNTIMWLDTGIDTGKIITTEQTALDGLETLTKLQYKNMVHGNDLYVRAICQIAEGKQVPAVSQNSIDEGTTFYTSEWDLFAMLQAKKNFERHYAKYFANKENHQQLTSKLKLVSLNEENDLEK